MKKIALVLLMMVFFSGTAMAGEKFSLDVEVDYTSRYIWRGMDLIPDDHGAVQPWVNAGYAVTDKLTVNYLFWADYRLIDGGDSDITDDDWDEFDHVAYLTYAINDTFSYELGYIYYYLPSLDKTQEVYAGVSATLNDNLSTSLYVYYDFDNSTADGIYAEWALDASMPLSDTAKLLASAGIGYMDYDDNFDSGFANLPLSVGISVDLGHNLGMFVSVNYSFTLDALRDNDLNHENEAWVMSGISYSM